MLLEEDLLFLTARKALWQVSDLAFCAFLTFLVKSTKKHEKA